MKLTPWYSIMIVTAPIFKKLNVIGTLAQDKAINNECTQAWFSNWL